MDPFAHTFTGAALAASGLRKITPLATAALIIGANAPDIDVVTAFQDTYLSLAHRRGWTHGILAWVILPFLVAGLLLMWDRFVRQRNRPTAAPAEFWVLLLMSTIGVLSHPTLDWLNNYGIRLLMPFDGRWFYGDALFIIDPWVWLSLGGVAFLTWSHSRLMIVIWSMFWLTSTWLVSTNPLVPDSARVLWLAGIAVLMGSRFGFSRLPQSTRWPGVATLCVAVVFTYMAGNALASLSAQSQVRDMITASGYNIESVMVGPVPTTPFKGQVVVDVGDRYLLGSWHWLKPGRLSLSPIRVPKNLHHPAAIAASENLAARRFLTWSRFPYTEIVALTPSSYQVRFLDARYAGMNRGIKGPVVNISLP